jgi:predicted outer membrane repeat protein
VVRGGVPGFAGARHHPNSMHPMNPMNTILARVSAFLLTLLTACTASAATITVNNNADSGAGSLRAQIAAAAPGDTINFGAPLSGNTITLASTITLAKNVTIDASALTNGVTISGGSASLFVINGGTTVAFKSLTLTGGGSTYEGGAIVNSGTVTLTQCTLFGNSATDVGGAIANSGTMTLTQCTLSGNSAGGLGEGGAIANGGTMTLTLCTLSGNSTNGSGGAINNEGGTVTLMQCTLSGNSTGGGYGGAINNEGGTVTLTQCTLSGNSSGGGVGGAIFNDDATLTLTQCTLSGNSATGDGSVGGGIDCFEDQSPPMVLTNCIVAGNSANVGADILTNGTVTLVGANIINTAPNLAPLGNYGGPTQTMPPLPGSPAINAAVGSLFTTDQRGFAITDGKPDIGATEEVIFVVVTNTNDSGAGSLRDAVATASGELRTVTFSAAMSGQTIVLGSTITAGGSVSIDASGLPGGITIGGATIGGAGAGANFGLFSVAGGSTVAFTGLTLANGGGSSFGGSGGAISSGGAVTLSNCTLSGNSAASGGAISSTGTLTLTQCTLAGNSATGGNGGAIESTGALTLTHCTVSGNSAGTGSGGGIDNGGTLTLDNSIVAGDTAAAGTEINSTGTITLAGANFVASIAGSGLGSSSTLLTTADNGVIRLGALANNGGPTKTMKLLPGSVAINAVPDASVVAGLTTDQRGTGFLRKIGAHVDLGAVEASNVSPDINGDGKSDFVFQDGAGQVYAWFLDGTGNTVDGTGQGIITSGFLHTAGLSDWRLAGTADVNGDGIPDLVFQNTLGQIYVWFMDGTGNTVTATGQGTKGSGYLFASGLGDWRLVAVADVNGDGIPDLIFQNTLGQVYAWFLDGTGNTVDATGQGIKSTAYLFTGGLGDWRVAAVADVNGDGIPDLIFQNTLGQVYAWFLDGTGNTVTATGQGIKSAAYLFTGGLADWRVMAVADVNGDGIPDLIFQNTVGQIYAWFLDGTGNAVTATSGLVSGGSKFLFTGGLGDWRIR